MRIALSEGLTIYDSLYIALAIDKGLPLLTLDERQKSVALKLNIRVYP